MDHYQVTKREYDCLCYAHTILAERRDPGAKWILAFLNYARVDHDDKS